MVPLECLRLVEPFLDSPTDYFRMRATCRESMRLPRQFGVCMQLHGFYQSYYCGRAIRRGTEEFVEVSPSVEGIVPEAFIPARDLSETLYWDPRKETQGFPHSLLDEKEGSSYQSYRFRSLASLRHGALRWDFDDDDIMVLLSWAISSAPTDVLETVLMSVGDREVVHASRAYLVHLCRNATGGGAQLGAIVARLLQPHELPLEGIWDLAVKSGPAAVLRLAQLGALKLKGAKGEQALLLPLACRHWPEIAEALIECVPSVGVLDPLGQNALMALCYVRHERVVPIAKALIRKGININHRNKAGLSAYDMAVRFGADSLTRLLMWKMWK